jgi:phosphate transport system substrate-binding protein
VITPVDNNELPATQPAGPPKSRTSFKRILILVVIGGLLAAAVYASPRFLIKEEPTPSFTNLKTGGTSVVSVLVENRWRPLYLKEKNIKIDYESTGSTAGVDQMMQKQLAIAFTHAPMTPEQRNKAKEAGGEVIHVPIVLCSVVPVYNISQLKGKKPINFTGEVLGKIFLGTIRTWNDPELKAINRDLDLPATPITVVHREDSSGTTLIFTDYLSKACPQWKEKFPRGAAEIAWPVGIGAKRNLNLAIEVANKDGAIGYVDLLYTHFRELELEYGAIQNADKSAFLRADRENMTAAAQASLADVHDDLTFDPANRPGSKSYPISGVIYAICYRKQPDASRSLVVDFLHWATHEGQEFAEKMSYAPLPPELIGRVDQRLKLID